jgi:hypothetical protein
MTRALQVGKAEADPRRDRRQLHGSSFAAMWLGGIRSPAPPSKSTASTPTPACANSMGVDSTNADQQRRDDRNYLLSFMSLAQV